ncbi:MAG: response regulator transcription factor [Cyclobacteriaceae bacterium]|nr:response regulator transcription factor [Cyclobacteriaceae bacterium]
MKLRCLIVDDEPIARKGLEEYVSEISFLELTHSCESARKAADFLKTNSIDLILLDIQMPKVSGIEFLRALENPPLVIFTTAYSEYALEGYSLDVIDFLLKPISFDRFLKAAQKANEYYQLKEQAKENQGSDYFFIKVNHQFEKVNYDEVLYLEAMQNYCIVHTSNRKLITYHTLGGLERQLPTAQFLKVHKSFIVALDKISALDSNELKIESATIPISRSLKDEVMKKVMGNKLFKR